MALAADERMQLAHITSQVSFHGEWLVTLEYFRVDRDGMPRPNSYAQRSAEIPIHAGMHDGAVVDTVMSTLRYLAATLRPPRKPKGYRLLFRRLVLAPRAAPRRRLAR